MLVGVELLKIRVNSYSAKDNSVTLEIHFDDGEMKQIFKTTKMEKPESVVDEIYLELIQMEENIHMHLDDRKMVNGDIDVVIQDRKKDKDTIVPFFKKLKVMMANIKSMQVADGYLRKIADINRMELNI